MKRLHVKFIKWLSNKFGYKIVMLKGKNGVTTIEGDKEVLPYVDISGYFFKKEPLRRNVEKDEHLKMLKMAFLEGQRSIEGVLKYERFGDMDPYASTKAKYNFETWANQKWKYGKNQLLKDGLKINM